VSVSGLGSLPAVVMGILRRTAAAADDRLSMGCFRAAMAFHSQVAKLKLFP